MIAVLSAISAVAYAGLGQVWAALTAATGPVGGAFIGLFQFGHLIAGGVIRRPGSVFLTSVLSTVVQAFLGDPAGFYVIGWGVTHGIGAELVFLLMGGYGNPTWFVMCLAAGVAAICGHLFSYSIYGWSAARYLFFISIPILFLSSALESGMLSHLVLVALRRSRVVRNE
jgi:ABC-type thiamin/hydroxymethylpyrimidine transport system permease subunit